MKCCEDFKNRCRKILKNSILINFVILWWNYFVIAKFSKNLILIYFIILWWNDVRISKIIAKKLKKFIFMYSIILWWNDVRISKITVEKFLKNLIFIYFTILWWNDVRISKIIAANFEMIFHNDFSNPHSIPSQSIVECKKKKYHFAKFATMILKSSQYFITKWQNT